MWSSPHFSYSCSCALSSTKYTTPKKNKHGVMLKTGVSPFCSYVLWVGSLPNSCTKNCSLLSGALYCFITSTGYGTFLPFVLRPLQNQDPESLGTGISPWLVHTTGKPFPDPMNCLPSTNPDPLVCPYPSWVHSERVCNVTERRPVPDV